MSIEMNLHTNINCEFRILFPTLFRTSRNARLDMPGNETKQMVEFPDSFDTKSFWKSFPSRRAFTSPSKEQSLVKYYLELVTSQAGT